MNKLKYSNKSMLIFFSLFFVFGTIGLSLFGLNISGYIFAHIGALGLLGFFGLGATYFANKKGYSDKLALNLAFSLAIIAGFLETIFVFLFVENEQFVCGGAASLIVAFIVLITYMLLKSKIRPSRMVK